MFFEHANNIQRTNLAKRKSKVMENPSAHTFVESDIVVDKKYMLGTKSKRLLLSEQVASPVLLRIAQFGTKLNDCSFCFHPFYGSQAH